MLFNKSVSLLLVASQIGMGSLAFADSGVSRSNSPELTLVENVLALEGQNLPQAELQTKLSALISAYSAAAPSEGSSARLEQALVTLGMYTPEQARSFVADSQASFSKLMASPPADPSALQSSVAQTIGELATFHPAGAQFSACEVGEGFGVIASIGVGYGILSVFTGAIVDGTGHTRPAKGLLLWGGVAIAVGALASIVYYATDAGDCD